MSGEIWTNEDVGYVIRDDLLPGKPLSDGALIDGWFVARKKVLTPMKPLKGPATVVTQEGDYDLPDGWTGYVAIDTAGYPYPIEVSEFESAYEVA